MAEASEIGDIFIALCYACNVIPCLGDTSLDFVSTTLTFSKVPRLATAAVDMQTPCDNIV